jgi:hypothetical protein
MDCGSKPNSINNSLLFILKFQSIVFVPQYTKRLKTPTALAANQKVLHKTSLNDVKTTMKSDCSQPTSFSLAEAGLVVK